ncbi:MAG: hypothetical protein M1814_005088 [Vezdaea aestivalis]|nr:MAG: hypothetical protein M1814_005088 [Vezdaea aestivalis]
MKFSLFAIVAGAALTSAWLPSEKPTQLFERLIPPGLTGRNLPSFQGKIRGVNLGSWLVAEPWMMGGLWRDGMGCGSAKSEFDCVSFLKQETANAKFQSHWASWITKSDLQEMKNYGLNTIRIPVGYWIYDDIVLDSEHFPRGGLKFLTQMCGWAAEIGLYIIIDLHGAPYAQQSDAFTGQLNPNPGFYGKDGYARAVKFWQWMTKIIHTDSNFRTVGMVGILNEPTADNPGRTGSMITDFYPTVLKKIRETEASVGAKNKLHVQFMDKMWRSGDATQALPKDDSIAFSDHNYIKYANPGPHQQDYISASCRDNRMADGQAPKIVDEWSLSIADDLERNPEFAANAGNKDFYSRWFSAQIQTYEKQTNGWVFWSWRNELGDYRWSYKLAVESGAIPKDLNAAVKRQVC